MDFFNKLFKKKEKSSGEKVIDLVTEKATRDAELLNESLSLANNATSYHDKMSHISTAKSKLDEVKELVSQYSFINLAHLDDVQLSITELENEASQIIPRKVELRELSKEIGSTIQKCPYCDIVLAKFPQRKTKCKSCEKYIFSKKEPLSKEKWLFREDELELYDEIKELSIGSWDWWNENQQQIAKAKPELAAEWGVAPSAITDGDAKCRPINNEISLALANEDWSSYLSLREGSLRQLVSENMYEQALETIPECIYLTYAALGPADHLVDNLFDKHTHHPLSSLYKKIAGDIGTFHIAYKEFFFEQ